MSLRLILMRHAKSDWHIPAAKDFDRPLNGRGRASATRIGVWLSDQGYIPDIVLCSASARTRETWRLVAQEINVAPDVQFLDNLYLASPETMFQTLRSTVETGTVMMISHNPGSAILASALVAQSPPHDRFKDYPTASTLVVDFDVTDWSDLKSETGRVVEFVTPKDLP